MQPGTPPMVRISHGHWNSCHFLLKFVISEGKETSVDFHSSLSSLYFFWLLVKQYFICKFLQCYFPPVEIMHKWLSGSNRTSLFEKKDLLQSVGQRKQDWENHFLLSKEHFGIHTMLQHGLTTWVNPSILWKREVWVQWTRYWHHLWALILWSRLI